jgi:hypothetical protein
MAHTVPGGGIVGCFFRCLAWPPAQPAAAVAADLYSIY